MAFCSQDSHRHEPRRPIAGPRLREGNLSRRRVHEASLDGQKVSHDWGREREYVREGTPFRYIWDPASYDGIDSVPLPFSQTWSPEVILHNSVEEKFIYRRVGVVRHTGEIVYVVSVHTKSACEPNYESYPFGMQLCSLKFGSWVNGQGG